MNKNKHIQTEQKSNKLWLFLKPYIQEMMCQEKKEEKALPTLLIV